MNRKSIFNACYFYKFIYGSFANLKHRVAVIMVFLNLHCEVKYNAWFFFHLKFQTNCYTWLWLDALLFDFHLILCCELTLLIFLAASHILWVSSKENWFFHWSRKRQSWKGIIAELYKLIQDFLLKALA